MSAMEWSASLESGLVPMDETHKEFVQCLNEMAGASADQFLVSFDRFIAHTERHFEQENDWMASVDFPGCHKAEHDRVLAVIHDVRKRVEQGDVFLGKRLVEELPGWFEQHACGMDAALAHYLNVIGFDVETGRIASPQSPSESACAC